jgi:hypothetical protein
MNLYDVIQDNNKTITSDVFCLEMYLNILIELKKITEEQRINFLKSIPVGLPFRFLYDKLNELINKE